MDLILRVMVCVNRCYTKERSSSPVSVTQTRTRAPSAFIASRKSLKVLEEDTPGSESWQEAYVALQKIYIHFGNRKIIYDDKFLN